MEGNLGNLVVYLTTDLKNFNDGLKQAENNIRNTTGKITEYTNKIGTTMTVAGAAITGAFAMMIKASVDYGDQIYEVSQRTGVAVETLSALKYVAEQTESSFEAVAMGMKFLNRNIYDAVNGNKAMNDNFRTLGITLRDEVTGNVLKADEAFLKIADKFKNLEDSSAKSALAIQIFGRSGDSLVPILNLGSEGIKKLSDEASRLGLVLTSENAKSIDTFSDNMKSLKAAMGGLWLVITQTLIPALTDFIKKATDTITKIREWSKEHPGLIKAVAELGVALLAIGTSILVINKVLTSLQSLYIILNAILPLMKVFTTFRMAGLVTDIGILVANVGFLYPLLVLIGTAFSGWKLGRFIGEVTGLDNALSGPDGLFTKMWAWLIKNEEKVKSIQRTILAISTLGLSEVFRPKQTTFGGGATQGTGAGGGFGEETPVASASNKTQLDETINLVERHAEALKTLNDEYLVGKITAQEYYDEVLKLHQDGLDIKQQELDLLKQSIDLEYFATDAEYQKIFVTQQGIQTIQQYYEARAQAANADETATIKTFQAMGNLQKTINDMQPTWGAFFDFINMGIQKFSTGFSTAISSIILHTKTAKEAFADFGKMMIESIVEFVVQWAVQAVIALTIGKLIEMMVGSIADSMAVMWMPAAILASIATFGGAAAAGTAAVAGSVGAGFGLLSGVKAAQAVPIAHSAEGNLFTRPALTTIAEREPEGVFPLSKLDEMGQGKTINITIESPTVSSDVDINSLAEEISRRVARGTAR